jgi:hypothetical protein
MRLTEAKAIVGFIMDWQFVILGVKERKEVQVDRKFKDYSLCDLMKANSLIKSNNRRKAKLREYYQSKGFKCKGYSVSMILDDRLIAACYTALHFEPNGNGVCLMNDVVVGCVKASYE